MSHVDEGALHAYLDGALDEYPAAEAQRVREHLEICAACREQLETERGIREAAGSILALAAPEVEVPTFEELRAYVRANAPKRSPVSARLYRLSWAASVVLALGTGWLLRGGQVPVSAPSAASYDQQRLEASQESPATAGRGAAESERAVEEARAEAAPAAGSRSVQEAQTPPPAASGRAGVVTAPRQFSDADARVAAAAQPPRAPAADDTPGTQDVVAALVVRSPEPLAGPAELPATASRLDEVVTDTPAVTRERATNAARVADAAEPRRRSAPDEVVTSATQAGAVAGLAAQGRGVEFGDARNEVSDDEDSVSLVVPNLEVLEVRFRGPGVRPEGQVVLQMLESGDTLQVIHLPPEIDPSSLEELGPGDTELVVQRAAGWIVMRAPLSEARLFDLMERLLAER